MNIHEYQAKQLLVQYGVHLPEFHTANSIDEATAIFNKINKNQLIVKAQVHAGGRGKAGGVKLINTLDQITEICDQLLGKQLITKQSAPDGQIVNTLLLQAAENIEREFYLGMLVDRSRRRVTIICSAEGGMDIETIAKNNPDAITTINIDPVVGILNYHIRKIEQVFGLDKQYRQQLSDIIFPCYKLFIDKDLSLLEINPLCLTQQGKLIILDAKMTIDDNALFRHPNLQSMYDSTQNDPKEHIAKQFDLNYIALNGNIACMVNGAGLAMATMDIIKLHGGNPANFLDVGGNTNKDKVAEAFKLILSDPNVEAILVNIFGGIVRCDVIAEGIINAITSVNINVPVVVRLEGTNVEQGKALLANSTLEIITANDLDDAAIKAVQATKNSS